MKWHRSNAKTPYPKGYFLTKKINPVVKFLTISDIIILTSFGLITPIFAIFIKDNIEGGSVEVAGFSVAIFLFTKSLGQVPIARLVDKIKGEKDDFWFLFSGSIGVSLVPLMYIFISTPASLYMVQFFYGLCAAMIFPCWMAVFTRHIDKNCEGVEWGVYRTMVDFGCAVAALLGGLLAYRFGFTHLFAVISVVSFMGSLFILFIYNEMTPNPDKDKKRLSIR